MIIYYIYLVLTAGIVGALIGVWIEPTPEVILAGFIIGAGLSYIVLARRDVSPD